MELCELADCLCVLGSPRTAVCFTDALSRTVASLRVFLVLVSLTGSL